MTLEEQLKLNNELLQQILLHTYANTEEENKAKQEEIEELDESIEKYQSEIDELKTKLADENNYKRTKSDFELKERPVIEELLSDSIAQEREDIFKSNQLYRKEQEQQTKMLGVYNGEVVKLKDEISIIEARLNKDAIAKKRGIAKKLHLSDDEVSHLQAEVAYKKELIEEGNQVMEICADEIRRYGRLITVNNDRLKHITEKEQKLSNILNSKVATSNDIDGYKIRLDRDELSKKMAALEAFENRKKYLLYDPSKEIREQILQNNKLLNNTGIKKTGIEDSFVPKDEVLNREESKNEEELSKGEPAESANEDLADSKVPEKSEEQIKSTLESAEELKEKQTEEPSQKFKPIPKERAVIKHEPAELVEINDATDDLKKQKLTEKIKKAWNKWRDKAIAAAVAAAITVTGGMAFANLNKNNNKDKTDDVKVEQPGDFVRDDSISKDFTFNRPFETIKSDFEKNKDTEQVPDKEVSEPIKSEENKTNNVVVEQPKNNQVEDAKQPEPKPEIKVPEVTPEIPEVEEEQPAKEEEKANEEIKHEQPKLEGVINNGEIETTILQVDGEYVDIPLKNGETICVKYGDNGETVPSEITIKYDGTDMYIYSPVVNTKSL